MALHGTFDTMPLSDVLEWLSHSASQGQLTVTTGFEEVYVFVDKGKVVAVGSGDSLRVDFGQFLLATNTVDPERLQQALSHAGSHAHLKKALVAQTGLSYRDVAEKERAYITSVVMDLFFVDEGSFHFSPLLNPAAQAEQEGIPVLETPLSLREILFDGMRFLDEWRRVRELFPNRLTLVEAVGPERDDPVWRFLARYQRPVAVAELQLAYGGDRLSLYRSLFALHQAKALRTVSMDECAADHRAAGSVADLVADARLLLHERQYEEAREILATAASLEPDNPDVRHSLRQLRTDYLAYLYAQLPPHKTPVRAVDIDHLRTLPLGPKERFLAERITGKWDVGMLVVSSPLGELDTLRALHKLVHAQVVRLI